MYHQVLSPVFYLLLLFLSVARGQFEDLNLIDLSVEGTLVTRVFCEERVNCSGQGSSVFWAFFGSSQPLPATSTRFTETLNAVDDDGVPIIITTLVLSPAQESHDTLYQCLTLGGDIPFSVSLNLDVLSEPLEIISEIANIDLSNQTVGDNITVVCQVETCVSEVTVFLHKNDVLVAQETVSDNTMTSVSVAFPLTVEEDTAGMYACSAVATEGSTSNSFFNITGVPFVPSTSIPTMAMTSSTSRNIAPSTTTTTTSQQGSVSQSSTTGGAVGGTSTPSMTPSSSPGGASSAVMMVEWTLLLSLLIVTIVSGLLVW